MPSPTAAQVAAGLTDRLVYLRDVAMSEAQYGKLIAKEVTKALSEREAAVRAETIEDGFNQALLALCYICRNEDGSYQSAVYQSPNDGRWWHKGWRGRRTTCGASKLRTIALQRALPTIAAALREAARG